MAWAVKTVPIHLALNFTMHSLTQLYSAERLCVVGYKFKTKRNIVAYCKVNIIYAIAIFFSVLRIKRLHVILFPLIHVTDPPFSPSLILLI